MDMGHHLGHIFIRKSVIPAWIADPLESEANSRYQEVFELAIHDAGTRKYLSSPPWCWILVFSAGMTDLCITICI
jgi:hypothetical protein